jgi:hypothetical protein
MNNIRMGSTEIRNRAEVLDTKALDLVQRDDTRCIYPDSYIASLKPTEIVFCDKAHDRIKTLA